jgi:hypothetical protein
MKVQFEKTAQTPSTDKDKIGSALDIINMSLPIYTTKIANANV